MVKLDDILDASVLWDHVENGFISAREHNTEPWVIFNYTPICQFARNWDQVTLMSRGLVVNKETMEVLARPFPKFFNWDESGSPYPPSGPALRMEKLDGSLGILVTDHWINGTPTREWIATRGSFHSEQSEWATMFYHEVLDEQIHSGPFETVFAPVRDKTYLFEIIYPENRIVVDYGEYAGLVLLDVIDNTTGYSDTDEFDNCMWPDKVARHPIPGFDSGQTADIPEGNEGFVFLWPTRNFRTKMKSADYIALHRLVTGLSEKSIWEHLVAGGSLNDLKKDLPEEFHGFIDEKGNEIVQRASEIVAEVYRAYDDIEREHGRLDMMLRKEAAELIKPNGRLTKYMFLVLDGKEVYPVALKDSKPTREASLIREE